MTTMIAGIYDALREAGGSEQRSRAAAETLASYDDRFAGIDRHFDAVRGDIKDVRGEIREVRGEIRDVKTELKGDIRLLQWQLGILIAGVVTLVIKAFFGGH